MQRSVRAWSAGLEGVEYFKPSLFTPNRPFFSLSYTPQLGFAKRQYSGNVHGMVRGIGLVNLVHSSGQAGDFLPLDYRGYAPDQDRKTKKAHFLDMFEQVVKEGKLLVRTLLFDCWYVGSDNLKKIHRADWTFFTTLKSNRKVSVSKEAGY